MDGQPTKGEAMTTPAQERAAEAGERFASTYGPHEGFYEVVLSAALDEAEIIEAIDMKVCRSQIPSAFCDHSQCAAAAVLDLILGTRETP